MVRKFVRGVIFSFAIFTITSLLSFTSEEAWSKDVSSTGLTAKSRYLSPGNIERNILSGLRRSSMVLRFLRKNYGTNRLLPLWRGKDVTYGILGGGGNEYRRLIHFFLNDIYKSTGLSVRFDRRADIIFIVEDNAIKNLDDEKKNIFYKIGLSRIAADELRKSLKGGSCGHSLLPNKNGDLATAIIIADTTASEKSITRCLYHGVVMSTGFMPEARKLYSLSNTSLSTEQYILDKISLNILYRILLDGKEISERLVKKYISEIVGKELNSD